MFRCRCQRSPGSMPVLLADRGRHLSASIPVVLVAAIADADKNFDLIAQITGQPVVA